MNFISSFLEYTKQYESPTSFWKWSAYATLAAILRDNIFRQLGSVPLYPNIYVLFLAESATQRKGHPVDFCERFVRDIGNTKLISGRSSIQAILDELARTETDKITGKSLTGGSAMFSAKELAAGIVSDPAAVQILTDIYDFKEVYTSRLRGTGTFKIKNICFSMIAASNEDLLRDVYDIKAIFGGLLGRTFLVRPNEFRPGNSLFRVRDATEQYNELLEILHKVALMRGEMFFTDEAQTAYDEWYIPFRESYKTKVDKSGVSGRVHISILKIAMLICINETLDYEIQACHIEKAIEECLALMPNYNSFIMGGGKSNVAESGTIFLTELYSSENHTLSRKRILQKHWNNFDAESLDKIVTTLSEAGMISSAMHDDGIAYTLTAKCISILFEKKT